MIEDTYARDAPSRPNAMNKRGDLPPRSPGYSAARPPASAWLSTCGPEAASSHVDGQRLHPAQKREPTPARAVGRESEVRKAAAELAQRHLSLEARELRAEAEVNALPEG